MRLLPREAGAGDAAEVAAAARRGYDDLTVVLVPLIGQVGVDALAARAIYLAQQEFPWGQAGESEEDSEPFTQVTAWLKGQDTALATDAAATMLVTFAALLATFIGEPMTMRLLRKAWPDGFSDTRSKET